jgi:hypothetical protein
MQDRWITDRHRNLLDSSIELVRALITVPSCPPSTNRRCRILTMNGKAKQILRQGPASGPMHKVGELIRLGEGLSWIGIATAREGQATRIDYRNPAGEVFSMTIELVNQLLLITFAERDQHHCPAFGTGVRLPYLVDGLSSCETQHSLRQAERT